MDTVTVESVQAEANAIIATLSAQRNDALDQVVRLNATLTLLRKELDGLKAELADLQKVVGLPEEEPK